MAENSQLKMLMDYTLFHIGAYITLSTLLVSILGLKAFENKIANSKCCLFITLVCFVFAGMCGGIVASNLPFHSDFEKFKQSSIGPFFATKALPSTYWMSAEHVFFWLGVIAALYGLIRTQITNTSLEPSSGSGPNSQNETSALGH
jgi:hypothetical protein